jgi:radical SAM superfamily enzyme YgiQ (UPF0313 family)
MVNASFVFGMDGDDPSVFARTVDWAVRQGIHTATFHILTPYPGTVLNRRYTAEGRILHSEWDLYDTRHAVFRPARMTAAQLEAGYRRAYREFYGWPAIVRSAWTEANGRDRLRHLAYTAGWKKMEPLWDIAIRHGRVQRLLPLLEALLAGSGDRHLAAGRRGPGRQRADDRRPYSPRRGDDGRPYLLPRGDAT